MVVNYTVDNVVQAKEQVEKLELQGYLKEDIYIFAHSKRLTDNVADSLHTEEIGMEEQGFIENMKNIFSSRGDELRSKMSAAGLTDQEAANAEVELDKGKLVIIANK